MAPRRKTTASPKLRPKKRRGQASYSYPMPDLFPRSVRTLLRQRYTHIPDNHHLSQVSEEQIPGFIERAWEHADPDTQAHFCRLANGLPGIQPRSVKTGPVVSDVQPPPRKSSRARGKKASARSRAKRTAPPTVQDQPETPPSHSGLDHTFPPTPHSTSSSVSIPLHTVVRSGGPPAPDAGSAPHAQRPDDALLPDMPPFPPNNSHRGGGLSSGSRSSFPFVPPAYAYGLPPLDHGQAPGPTAYQTGLGLIPESVNGGAHPVSDVDLSLLDEQRRMRDQMREFYYQSPSPSAQWKPVCPDIRPGPMSHALLLRLFLSPSFFSVHVALQYLRIYADNIGITYYLTRRLRELNTQELREVWGFVCHLVVTRPTQSKALESFVVEICHKSTHVAMLTLWYMQAFLKDLSTQHSTNASFLVCQRILHECHEIIFGDLPSVPYSGLCPPTNIGPSRKKVRPHVSPSMVGIGMVLAGVPGLPQLTDIMGPVAIEQGRVDELGQGIKSIERGEDDGSVVRSLSTASTTDSGGDAEDDDSMDSPVPDGEQHSRETTGNGSSSQLASAIPKRMSRRQTVGAHTSPALPLRLREARKPRLSEDPFGQEDVPPTRSATVATPFQSTPTFSRYAHRPNSLPTADLLLQKYDFASQMHLLRGHFSRSEVQFILALENICNKLLVVPKPARVSALRAELTGLNHMLPAEICMPMWCSSSDEPQQSSHNVPEPHHRIVRIPPGESVVLNSAERAPYLLLIEILHSDLDFDPAKRGNKEILKKIVLKENESKGTSKDLVNFAFNGSSKSKSKPAIIVPDHVTGSEAALGDEGDAGEGISIPHSASSSSVVSPSEPPEEEEIDLVEQLYGDESSLKADNLDLSDSIVLPPAPRNKELDMAAWSRASSNPHTPQLDKPDPFSQPNLSVTPATRPSSHPSTPARQPSQGPSQQRVISLDEYSERMRTAAVMLAQLNANLIPSAIPGTPVPTSDSSIIGAPLRWLPGTSWLSGSPANGNGYPVTPGGAGGDAPMRMRLQASEAAAIRDRIMVEMLALEEERMARMRENGVNEGSLRITPVNGDMKTAEDEGIIRRELSKVDPSAVVFSESWAAKKARVRQASPYGHLANWDCVSVIVKTGGDLRQEQLAVQLIQEFEKIWKDENCQCWVRYFRILITGNSSGLVETITDAVSIHSIKKAEYARRLAEGRLGHVTLLDHFKTTCGDPSSAKFVRAQRNFAKSLAGYSLVTYLLQIKDRHNGNILLDRDGHLIHIDFGFMLSNSPGNIGFEAAPFKLPLEYIEVLGGLDGPAYREFRKLFREGFDACRKHCDRIVTLVELMQKDSTLPCFAAFGEQTASQLRDRFQQGLTQSAVEEHVQRLIDTSLGSNWTRLYDSYQYYSQSIL